MAKKRARILLMPAIYGKRDLRRVSRSRALAGSLCAGGDTLAQVDDLGQQGAVDRDARQIMCCKSGRFMGY